jgi:hypothetical protein
MKPNPSKPDIVEEIVRKSGPICAKDVYELCDELTDHTAACAVLNALRKQERVVVIGHDQRGRMLYAIPGADIAAPLPESFEPPPARNRKAAAKTDATTTRRTAPAPADAPQITHSAPPDADQLAPPPVIVLAPAPVPDPVALERGWLSINGNGELRIGETSLSREQTEQLGHFLLATSDLWDL